MNFFYHLSQFSLILCILPSFRIYQPDSCTKQCGYSVKMKPPIPQEVYQILQCLLENFQFGKY